MRGTAILQLTAMSLGLCLAASAASAAGCPGGVAPAKSVVHGPVLEIPSASSLCIAEGQSPSTWVEVRLPQWDVPHAVMMAAAFGKNATCAVAADGHGDCRVEATPLAAEVRQPAMLIAASAWRTPR
jgi:hypothetical protein